ncbi:Zn-dependent peptidase ImmA, M78 family [Ensifer adhaerens]|nr:Zn-dependent peptidase ImmA, M78 family [Ensifer adhaerens]
MRLARSRAGLSLAALSDKLDPRVSPQALNKYERGEMMPSSSVLMALSRALGVSLDFLMNSQVVALDGVEFRKEAHATERDRSHVEAEVIDHVERYLAVEEILQLGENASALDKLTQVAIDDLEEAEEQAVLLRKAWNLGNDPIPSITALLEERNVRVLEIEGPDSFYGLTCRVRRPNNRPPITVIVRRHVNVERNRFTLAHEIAHVLISDCKSAKVEKAMDRFAAAFLIPADHLRNEIGASRTHFAYRELVRLKHLYGVSMMALFYRLKDINVISDDGLKAIFKTPARAWLKEEPDPLDPEGEIAALERPQRFESYVYRALAEGLISSFKGATLLRKPVEDVELAVRGPR